MARRSRSSEEPHNREKTLPHAPAFTPAPAPAPAPVTRTASEPVTYLSMRGPPNFGDPAMRTELREAARRASEAEERAAVREEAARQARIKWLREQDARKAAEDEEERRAQLERDLARSAAVRMAREEEERAEEERRAQERVERRQRDAERRAEVARKLEEQRLEELRRLEEIARTEEELKRKAMQKRDAARLAGVKRRRESRLAGESLLLSGWVTVQNSGSVAWKRRYFQLTDTLMRFYNKEKVSSFADSSSGADSKWQAGYHWCPVGRRRAQGREALRQGVVRRIRRTSCDPSFVCTYSRKRRVVQDVFLRFEYRKGTIDHLTLLALLDPFALGSTLRSSDDMSMTACFKRCSWSRCVCMSPSIRLLVVSYTHTLTMISSISSPPFTPVGPSLSQTRVNCSLKAHNAICTGWP